MDDLEPPKPPGTEDSRPEPEPELGAGAPGTTMVEQQQSVEFDSPDSGLPSSRNYSVASGIQSSIDEGQSMGFEEEEDGGGEEGPDGPVPAAHASSEPQDPSQEKASWARELEPGEELAAVCAAAYTVCGHCPGTVLSQPQETLLTALRLGDGLVGGRWGCPDCPAGGAEPISQHPQRALFSESFGSCVCCIPLCRHHFWPPTHS